MNRKQITIFTIGIMSLTSLMILVIAISILNNREAVSKQINKIDDQVSYPVTYINNERITYKTIGNYVSGGSDFYCPNNPQICEKIKNYYRNISNKNFEEAYKYGGKIRSFDNLINTYKDYTLVSASYIKEESGGTFSTYVTLVPQNKEIEYYKVSIKADENSILSSVPTQIENNFSLDCNYTDGSGFDVCVFLTNENEFANIFADRFFYKPQFYKGINLNQNETVFYSNGSDALDSWFIVYKYNTATKVLSFIDSIHYKAFPDINRICTEDLAIDLSKGGCAEQYLTSEEIESNKNFLETLDTYQIEFD